MWEDFDLDCACGIAVAIGIELLAAVVFATIYFFMNWLHQAPGLM
jgi:hypothetical protein